ncbi:hypothetical protein COV23_01485 [Candidatus Wolfebacteria bacterium CG10_big_fil_rev_8_21_14_0_10_31_9]|uniref:Adenylate kinase n=1 Tax=Candidatus Wolfebacteria bacterium CG10_big_fil_rev_8_21_14_0_10_31_9 TaxID=1975070 RepID=A0A2H0RC96_9BACT|nr:MAG: hypothetical protein COV23_01485 [Candidatus Wolfebacteria bacterium CG10_big_fil_rev_8_21_14_0_10_31_9]
MNKKKQNILSKCAIILYGPPGSGKGTQSKLLSEKLNLFNLDTGAILRQILNDPKNKNNKEIQKEKIINNAGILNTPSFVLKILAEKTKQLSKMGQSIIYSGSPRTMFEAFGDSKNPGLLNILKKEYGKQNIKIIAIEIPESETIRRNSTRVICSVCKTPVLKQFSKIKTCPFCDGKMEYRKDDNKNIIKTRLKEYKERTLPILLKAEKDKYKIIKINGSPAPFMVYKKLLEYF